MPRAEGKDADVDDHDDNEALLECCCALEDLLLDDIMPCDIYMGDEDEEAGSEEKGDDLKPGQLLFVDIQNVCKRALPSFVDAVKDGLQVGEYLPEHQEFHSQYLSIIEDAMSKCVDHFGFNLNSFVSSLRELLSYNPNNVMAYATARELLEVIECVEKFNSFAEGMRIKAVQYLEKEDGTNDEFDFGRRR
mmetsp:Transcript_4031/g.8106  ORF Transcript_4031/g.8106 Transcript_4031/m.8106 type:complete len:191 (+) Transcript_4031:60-632(+)